MAKLLLELTSGASIDSARLISQPEVLSSTNLRLRSGLYALLPPNPEPDRDSAHNIYLIYWPEETTWCDNASLKVQDHRTLFMRYLSLSSILPVIPNGFTTFRYLTQLTDQIISLVSKEEARLFVWDSVSLDLGARVIREDGRAEEVGQEELSTMPEYEVFSDRSLVPSPPKLLCIN